MRINSHTHFCLTYSPNLTDYIISLLEIFGYDEEHSIYRFDDTLSCSLVGKVLTMLPEALPMFTLQGVLYCYDNEERLWCYDFDCGWHLALVYSSLQEAMLMKLESWNVQGMLS